MSASKDLHEKLSMEWIYLEDALAHAGIITELSNPGQPFSPRVYPFAAYQRVKDRHMKDPKTKLPWLQKYVVDHAASSELPDHVMIYLPGPLSHIYPNQIFIPNQTAMVYMILCKHFADLVALYKNRKEVAEIKAIDMLATQEDQELLRKHSIMLERVLVHGRSLDKIKVENNTAVCCAFNSLTLMEKLFEANAGRSIKTFGYWNATRYLDEKLQQAGANGERIIRLRYPFADHITAEKKQSYLLKSNYAQRLLNDLTHLSYRKEHDDLAGILQDVLQFFCGDPLLCFQPHSAFPPNVWFGLSQIDVPLETKVSRSAEHARYWSNDHEHAQKMLDGTLAVQERRTEWLHSKK